MNYRIMKIFSALIILPFLMIFSDQSVTLNTIMDCRQVFHSEKTDQGLINFKLDTPHLSGAFYTADRPLLRHYAGLKEKLAWVTLANLPTPVRPLTRLGQHLGHTQLYLKDDGMTDCQIGGNKLRKLEPVLADALYQGADDVFTFGAVGSNLVTQACFGSNKLGLRCSVFLTPEPNSLQLQNNLLLDRHYSAHFHFYPDNEFRKIGALDSIMQHVLLYKKFPYIVPIGASCPLGAVGYINAAFELKEQIDQGLLPEPDYIYISVGSVGTITGLALGLKLLTLKSKIIAISSSPDEDSYYQKRFLELTQQTNQLLHDLDGSFPLVDSNQLSVVFNFDFVGEGYACFTPEGTQAIALLKELEGLQLENVYTGKCVAGLINHIEHNPELQNKTILFWNTFGISQQIQDQQFYKQLPQPLHRFFEEPVQEDFI